MSVRIHNYISVAPQRVYGLRIKEEFVHTLNTNLVYILFN